MDPRDPDGFVRIIRGRVNFLPEQNGNSFFTMYPFRNLDYEFERVSGEAEFSLMEVVSC